MIHQSTGSAAVKTSGKRDLLLTGEELTILRGQIARQQKDQALAEALFEELYHERPNDFPVSNQLALVLIDQADETKRARALELAEANARQSPTSTEAFATLGWVYYRLGRKEEAEQALKFAASYGMPDADTAYYLAHILADRGRTEEVKQWLRVALDHPGRFIYRHDAQEWLDRLTANPGIEQKNEQKETKGTKKE